MTPVAADKTTKRKKPVEYVAVVELTYADGHVIGPGEPVAGDRLEAWLVESGKVEEA